MASVARHSSNSGKTDFMDPKLMKVAREGNIDGLKQLIQKRDPSILLVQITPMKDTLLHIAAMFEHLNFLVEVCELSPSLISKINLNGDTALHVGVRVGHVQVVKYLIDRMVSIEIGSFKTVHLLESQNHKGDTVLHEALRYCHPDIAELLIQKDHGLCHLVNKASESPLYLAVTKGYNTVVDQILQSSPSSPYSGPEGWTALHASIMADVNDDNASTVVDDNNASGIPLPASAEVNDDNASRTPLLVSIDDNVKMTASQAHIVDDEGPNMTKKLLQVKPELARVRDIYERTPLHFAVEINKPGIVRVMLKKDASLACIRDKDGWSPLHVLAVTSASKKPTLDMIKVITESCPDIGYLLDDRGNNFLHLLVTENKRMDEDVKGEIILELLKIDSSWKVLLNQPNNDGNTPLHLATLSRSIHCVRALTNARVDKTARNNINLTAYDIARYLSKFSSQQKRIFLNKWSKIRKMVRPDEGFSLQSSEPSLWIKTLVPEFEPIAKEDEYHEDDEKYRKRVSKTHMLVATLIATVSLAAAFQIPGGYEIAGETKGMAVLAGEITFKGFVVTNMIALSCSVLTLVLYSVAYIFDVDNPPKFKTIAVCGVLILSSVICMMEAFACGMISVLPRTHSSWVEYLTILVCVSIPFIGLLLASWFHWKKDDKFLIQKLFSMVDGDA